MPPHVVDADQCGGAVTWTQGFEREVVSGVEVIGELVSRRDHCAVDHNASLRWRLLDTLLHHLYRGQGHHGTSDRHLR